MKKSIIVVNNNAHVGGVQKSLINLLNEIKNDYEVTLFLFKKEGEYLEDIPKEIKIIEGNKLLQILGTSQKDAKNIGKIYYILRGMCVIWNKIFGSKLTYNFIMKPNSFDKGFDYAISFLHSSNEKKFYGGCNEFVIQNIKASEKITFVHCDFLNYGGNTKYNRDIYKQFDKIVAVSENCRKRFIMAMPELEEKVYSVRNFNNYKEIYEKSNIEPVVYQKDYINIVTVSRLAEEKGIIRSLKAINDLVKSGIKIKWHIIGDGILKSEIESLINKENLNDNIILYGAKSNPYRYMKNADLFLLTSYHEAAPMVFDEATYLGVPIFATETTSTKEMIEDRNAGWICKNNDQDIYNGLKQLLTNNIKLIEKKRELKNINLDNSDSLKQFNLMIGSEK